MQDLDIKEKYADMVYYISQLSVQLNTDKSNLNKQVKTIVLQLMNASKTREQCSICKTITMVFQLISTLKL